MLFAVTITKDTSLIELFTDILNSDVLGTVFGITTVFLLIVVEMFVVSHIDAYRFSNYRGYNKRFYNRIKTSSFGHISDWMLLIEYSPKTTKRFYWRFFWILTAALLDACTIMWNLMFQDKLPVMDAAGSFIKANYFHQSAFFIELFVVFFFTYWGSIFFGSVLTYLVRRITFAKVPRARMRKVRNRK